MLPPRYAKQYFDPETQFDSGGFQLEAVMKVYEILNSRGQSETELRKKSLKTCVSFKWHFYFSEYSSNYFQHNWR